MKAANVLSTGSMVRANSREGFAICAGTHLRPGQGQRAEVTIVNLGTLPARFLLSEHAASNEFVAGRLGLAIRELRGDGSELVYMGEIGAVPAAGIDLGMFEAGESRTYRFTVLLDRETPEAELGRSASAAYAWRAVLGGV